MREVPDEKLVGPGRPTKHDYARLFDGKTYELTRGEDFSNEPKSARVTIYAAARRRHVTVATSIDGDHLYVRAAR